jgi:probable F420-dependent oxidoreductase
MTHPFRFGVQVDAPFEGMTWADTCRKVESLGYSTLFVPDHFDEGLGPIAAMAAAAAVTTELIVAPLVLDCDYRHPAVLSRELATIDQISEGRLEVGIGAGWKATDYEHSGIPMDRPGVRVDRMVEHAAILKSLLAGETTTFHGQHYQVTDLPGTPACHTPGGPKFLVGGGAPRVLRFAGKFADIVGVNASIHSGEIDTDAALDGMAERIDQKVEWVKEGAGARFPEIEINAWLAALEVTDDRAGMADLMSQLFGAPPAEVLQSPLALVGTLAEMTVTLEERRERWGYSYHCVPGDKAEAFAPVVADLAGK